MSEQMTFPKTWEEYEKFYGFTDTDQVYTNGSRLIQSYRVKQWLDHLQEYKETLCDCYCKFPDEYSAMYKDVDEAQENLEREKCDMCPLMNL